MALDSLARKVLFLLWMIRHRPAVPHAPFEE